MQNHRKLFGHACVIEQSVRESKLWEQFSTNESQKFTYKYPAPFSFWWNNSKDCVLHHVSELCYKTELQRLIVVTGLIYSLFPLFPLILPYQPTSVPCTCHVKYLLSNSRLFQRDSNLSIRVLQKNKGKIINLEIYVLLLLITYY